VVLYRNGQIKQRLCFKLGSEEDHMVAEAEGVGMILGLELIWREERVTRVSMAVDNMVALQRTMATSATPSHYIWDMFYN
jgi:hypothetical protein